MLSLYLASGLFLGWSLGASDAANVFGTAVTTGMIRYRTAVICAAVFVVLGAFWGGSGTSKTLETLGAINALPGAFVVAFAAAVSIYIMVVVKYPVSTSQAIVGAIVAWNIFTGRSTNVCVLVEIAVTWVICPILAAIFAMLLYKLTAMVINLLRPGVFKLDRGLRISLLVVGIFGAYTLGANNVANVVGVFIPSINWQDLQIPFLGTLSGDSQLFLLGGLAIAVGVITYSRRVMDTVGKGIMPLTPVGAFVAVLAHSLVLFIFASKSLSGFIASLGLPAIPLVPVSSTQAIVGAVVGIGLLKGGHAIKWKMIFKIASSWVTTPVLAGLICLFLLFVMQNMFGQAVYLP